MKIKTLIACLGAFITLISGVGFNTLNNQKEVNQNENIIITSIAQLFFVCLCFFVPFRRFTLSEHSVIMSALLRNRRCIL